MGFMYLNWLFGHQYLYQPINQPWCFLSLLPILQLIDILFGVCGPKKTKRGLFTIENMSFLGPNQKSAFNQHLNTLKSERVTKSRWNCHFWKEQVGIDETVPFLIYALK